MTTLYLAPHVHATTLPFGGLVLLNQETLALAEFGEADAEFITTLVTTGVPDDAAARKAVEGLIAGGWLTTTDPPDRWRGR